MSSHFLAAGVRLVLDILAGKHPADLQLFLTLFLYQGSGRVQ